MCGANMPDQRTTGEMDKLNMTDAESGDERRGGKAVVLWVMNEGVLLNVVISNVGGF